MAAISSEEQFLSAYDQYADAIFRHCALRLRDRERGKDLMQETFMKAWEFAASGKEIENIRAFLYRIANNLIVDMARRYKLRTEVSLEDMQEEGFDVPSSEDTTERTHQRFTQEQVMNLLGKIEEPYRTAVVMRYIDDLSPAEIAETLELSANVVSVRINRGMKKLRSLLEHS